ncbi:MAG: hypothetical protein H8E66_24955 [Planctomycetes bacterium]|nr:hypothetical protein [Planctomycetota bacterium]
MKKMILGIVIASVVLYMWGFVYWGLGPYPTMIWKHAPDDAAAGQALLAHFPENGTYFVPGAGHDQATAEGLFDKGPVAMVHMIAANGRPMMDPSIMVGGFLLNVVVIGLICILMSQVRAALPTYVDRVKFIALAGVTASVLIDCGDIVWWQIDWSWKLYNALYHVSAWVITGLILAKFIESAKN